MVFCNKYIEIQLSYRKIKIRYLQDRAMIDKLLVWLYVCQTENKKIFSCMFNILVLQIEKKSESADFDLSDLNSVYVYWGSN